MNLPDPRGQDLHPVEGSDAHIGDLWYTLLRRWRLFAGVTFGVIALVMGITMFIRPVYESEAVLRVRSDDSSSNLLDDLLPIGGLSIPGMGDSDVETEIGLLRSRRIADAVVDSIGLHLELVRPYRSRRTETLNVLSASQDAPQGVYTLTRTADGSYTTSARGTERSVSLPDRVRIGEPFNIDGLVVALDPGLWADPPGEVRFRVRPFQRVVTRFRDDLGVARQDSRSQLIEISYRHRDPVIAAGVVNGVIDYFLDYSMSSEKRESTRKAEILARQVEDYKSDVAAAEQRLQRFQEQARVVLPEEQATQQIRRIAELQVAHDALRVERVAIAALLEQIRAGIDSGSTEPPYRQLASFPSFISNGAVQTLLETLSELENERAELVGFRMRTDVNQDVQAIDHRVRELEGQLVSVGINYLQGLDHQIASTDTALAEFGREIAAIPAVELEFARLTRDQRLLSEVYLLLEARLRQTLIQEAIDDSSVRVVDFGIVPERPAFPRPLISLVLATVLGLMVGLFTVVAYESTKPGVHSRRDAERATPGVAVLATVPRIQIGGRSLQPPNRTVRVGPLLLRGRESAPADTLVARSDPWHPASEAYRALASNLRNTQPSAPQILVVTSALPGEGKTTLAANLGITLARGGTRTLLLDGDLRSGRLAALLDLDANPGWPAAILAKTSIDDVLQHVPVADDRAPLDLLAAGSTDVHPSELYGSAELSNLLRQVRQRYDMIIVDTPPLHTGFDATTLGGMADGVLLVVRSGVTGREALENAVDELRRARVHIAGVVLNYSALSNSAKAYAAPNGALRRG